MISKEELELYISGAVQQAAIRIESAHGRALTRTEMDGLSSSIGLAVRMVADRCAASEARIPPPPPAPAARTRAGVFSPLMTQELPRVTTADLEAMMKTTKAPQK